MSAALVTSVFGQTMLKYLERRSVSMSFISTPQLQMSDDELNNYCVYDILSVNASFGYTQHLLEMCMIDTSVHAFVTYFHFETFIVKFTERTEVYLQLYFIWRQLSN